MNLILGMAFFFIFITLIFVVIAIFLPEWMGITGNHAKRIIAEQQEQKPDETTPVEDSSNSSTPKAP